MLREYFNSTEFLYTQEVQVQVMSGRDEALNAWITANYLQNNYGKESTIGLLDLGGASTQISFIPDSILIINFIHFIYLIFKSQYLFKSK